MIGTLPSAALTAVRSSAGHSVSRSIGPSPSADAIFMTPLPLLTPASIIICTISRIAPRSTSRSSSNGVDTAPIGPTISFFNSSLLMIPPQG